MIKVQLISETGGFIGLFKNVNKGLKSELEQFELEGWTIVSVVNENTA